MCNAEPNLWCLWSDTPTGTGLYVGSGGGVDGDTLVPATGSRWVPCCEGRSAKPGWSSYRGFLPCQLDTPASSVIRYGCEKSGVDMTYLQDPQKRRGQMNKSFGPHVTAFTDRSASGGLSLAPSTLDFC